MKKLIVSMLTVGIVMTSAAMASAQGPQGGNNQFGGRGNRGQGPVLEAVEEATGLEREAIIEAVRGGQTLAEIITANGGDVAAVEAEIAAEIAERSGDDPAEVQARVNELLNSTEPLRDGREARQDLFGPEALDILSEATGLERQDLLQALRDGSTPTELITANGGDAAAVEAQIVTSILENRPDEAEIQTRVNEFLNNPVEGRPGFGGQGGRGQGGPGGRGQGQEPGGQNQPTPGQQG
jgi:hypothetical protein